MPATRYDTAFNVIQILRAAEALHAVAIPAVVARAAVDPAAIADPIRPLPMTAGARLVEAALALTADPLLGLKAGLMTPLRRTMGIAGVLMTHAPTVRIALGKAVMVQSRTGNVYESALVEHDETHTSLRVRRRVAPCAYTEQTMDFHVGIGVTSSRLYSDPRSHACAVEVPAERLEKVGRAVYEELVGCPAIPTVDHAGQRHRSDALLVPLPIDADVFGALDPIVERELGMLPSIQCLRDVVCAAIEQSLEASGRPPALATVARTLAMSPRTLQQRLRDEETSLRELLDDVRRRLALRWLAGGKTREEVSARLGFSESAAFRRAWRRWQA